MTVLSFDDFIRKLHNNSEEINILYNERPIRINIEYRNDFINISIPSATSQYLLFKIFPHDTRGQIDLILATDKAGQLADIEHLGTFLLQFAIDVMTKYGVESISLTDVSTIQCHNESIQLGFLRLLEKGKTWYQEYGFEPRVDARKFQTKLSFFKNYKLDNLLKILETKYKYLKSVLLCARACSTLLEIIAIIQESIEEFKKGHTETEHILGSYLVWLYRSDCIKYNKVLNIFSKKISGEFEEMTDLIKTKKWLIKNSSVELVKKITN
jgi:hypothetical protein